MTDLPISFASTAPLSWDGEGRRVSGGPLAPDVALPAGEDELSFSDLLSVFNPLQHIPVVSSVYRWVTGDTIKPAARVVGGALFGGPIGMVTAAFNAVVEQVKGADVGELALAMLRGDKEPDADTPPATAAAAKTADPAPDRPATAAAPVSTGAEALAQLAADLRSASEPTRPEVPAAVPAAGPASPPAAGQGRDITYYLTHAGQRIPAADVSKGRIVQPSPVPVAPAPVAAQLADEATKAASPAAPHDEPPAQWFNAAMMRGLDRYRAMQRGESTPQVDLSR